MIHHVALGLRRYSPRLRAAFLIGAATAGLAACATRPASLPKYVAPTSGPTAKLVMRGNVSGNDLFGVYVLDDADRCQGPRIVGAGKAGQVPPSSAFAANRLTTVDFMLFTGANACRVRWSFTPASGRTYLVAGGVVTGVPGMSCGARVMDATDPDKIRPVTDAVRRDQGSNACVALAQAQANKTGRSENASRGSGDAVLTPGASADDLKGLIPQ